MALAYLGGRCNLRWRRVYPPLPIRASDSITAISLAAVLTSSRPYIVQRPSRRLRLALLERPCYILGRRHGRTATAQRGIARKGYPSCARIAPVIAGKPHG
jgi:hypothetical protein